VSVHLSVRPSVLIYQLASHGADLSKITYWGILYISVEEIQIGLKSVENAGSLHEDHIRFIVAGDIKWP